MKSHSLPSGANVKNEQSCISTPPYALMACKLAALLYFNLSVNMGFQCYFSWSNPYYTLAPLKCPKHKKHKSGALKLNVVSFPQAINKKKNNVI
jgi:hypothetical protein